MSADNGSFRGDSPGKKLSRLKHWLAAANWMGVMEVGYRGALVLAGHGGDVSTLKGLGFDPSSITAVDRVKSLADYTAELHPDVFVGHGDVTDSASRGGRPYNAVQLNFCGGLTVENIKAVADAVRGACTLPCWVGVTFMKGREQVGDKRKLVPKLSRADRKALKRACRECYPDDVVMAEMFTHGQFDLKRYLALCEARLRRYYEGIVAAGDPSFCSPLFARSNKLTSLGQSMIRADALRQCLNAILWDAGPQHMNVRLNLVNLYSYHSGDGKNRGSGTPFVTAGFIAYAESQTEWVARSVETYGEVLMGMNNTKLDIGLRGLKHYAIDLLRLYSPAEVAQMLDIRKGTVVAWKAHATMGTYKEELAEMAKNGVGLTGRGSSKPVPSPSGWGKTGSSDVHVTLNEMARLRDEGKERRMAGGPRWADE